MPTLIERTEERADCTIEVGEEYLNSSVVVNGLLGSNTIAVYYVGRDGFPTPAYDSEGNLLEITETRPRIKLDGPMKIKFVKEETTGTAIGLELWYLRD